MIKVTIGQKTYEYEDGTTLYEIAREQSEVNISIRLFLQNAMELYLNYLKY
ncbi:MAG: hypothetical protein ACLUR5_03845 [Eubacterium ventriosum]